jgi:uncharacterized protein YbaA (DUF1428 family)
VFSSVYIYPVPESRIDDFRRIQAAALRIYREYGAIDDATYRPFDISAKYGCLGFDSAIELKPGEIVCISVSFFRDRSHHDEVMERVDNDPRITDLYEEITQVLDVARVLRGEFERIV